MEYYAQIIMSFILNIFKINNIQFRYTKFYKDFNDNILYYDKTKFMLIQYCEKKKLLQIRSANGNAR